MCIVAMLTNLLDRYSDCNGFGIWIKNIQKFKMVDLPVYNTNTASCNHTEQKDK